MLAGIVGIDPDQWAPARTGLSLRRPLLMYSSNSARYLLIAVLIGQAAPSARPQMVVPGIVPMDAEISSSKSISLNLPCPARIRSRILVDHAVPSRQGVH